MNQAYVPPESIEGFHNEILQGGEALIAMSSFEYPNANAVSDVIGQLHEIVAGWGLMGMWVTTQFAGGDYVMTKNMQVVRTTFLPLIVCHVQSITVKTVS
jgi:hypothetical protein